MTDHRDESNMSEELELSTETGNVESLESTPENIPLPADDADIEEQHVEDEELLHATADNAIESQQTESGEQTASVQDQSAENPGQDEAAASDFVERQHSEDTVFEADVYHGEQIVHKGSTIRIVVVPPEEDLPEPELRSAFSDSSSEDEYDVVDCDDDALEDPSHGDESLALVRMSSSTKPEAPEGEVVMLDTYDPTIEPQLPDESQYDDQGILRDSIEQRSDYHHDHYEDPKQAQRMQKLQKWNGFFHRYGPMPPVRGSKGDVELWHADRHLHKGRDQKREAEQVTQDMMTMRGLADEPRKQSLLLTQLYPETFPEAKHPRAIKTARNSPLSAPMPDAGSAVAEGGAGIAEHAESQSAEKWSDRDENDNKWAQQYIQDESRRRSQVEGATGDLAIHTSAGVPGESRDPVEELARPPTRGKGGAADDGNVEEVPRPPTRGKGDGQSGAFAPVYEAPPEPIEEEENSPLSPEFWTGEEHWTGLSTLAGYQYYKEYCARDKTSYNAGPRAYPRMIEKVHTAIKSPAGPSPQAAASTNEETLEEQLEDWRKKQIEDKLAAEHALVKERYRLQRQMAHDREELLRMDPEKYDKCQKHVLNFVNEHMPGLKGAEDMSEVYKVQMLRYRYSRFVYHRERGELRKKVAFLEHLLRKQDNGELPVYIADKKNQVKGLVAYSRSLEQEAAEWQKLFEAADQEVNTLAGSNHEMARELRSLQGQVEELEMTREFHDSMRQQVEILELEMKRAQENHEKVVETLNDDSEKAMAELREQGKRELDEVQEKAWDATTKAAEQMRDLQVELGQSRQESADLSNEVDKLTREVADAIARSPDMATAELQNDIERLEEMVHSLESDLAAQREAEVELAQTHAKCAKHEKRMQGDLDGALEQLTVADRRIEELDAELERLKAEREELEDMDDDDVSNLIADAMRLPSKQALPTRANRQVSIHTDSVESVPRALPTSDVTRTPHVAPLKTPILPGRLQAWVEREAQLMQTQAFLADLGRRQDLRKAREQAEKERLASLRRALAASCGWEEMPYVPKAQRWTHLVA